MIGVQGQNSLENCAGNPVMDTALSPNSTNGLQNRIIYDELTTRDNNIPWYGYCQTAASTQTKTASTSAGKFALITGAKVKIKFLYNNTHATPTLNIDSTGAVSIKAYGTTTPTLWWVAGDVVEFTYDGTNYIMGATEGQIQSLNNDLATKQNKYSYIDGKQGLNQVVYIDYYGISQIEVMIEHIDNRYYSVIINVAELPSKTYVYFPFGHYTTSADNSGGKLSIYKNTTTQKVSVSLNSYYNNGVDASAGIYIKVYAE